MLNSKANPRDPNLQHEGRASARAAAIAAATASTTKAASSNYSPEAVKAAKALLARKTT